MLRRRGWAAWALHTDQAAHAGEARSPSGLPATVVEDEHVGWRTTSKPDPQAAPPVHPTVAPRQVTSVTTAKFPTQ